MPNITEPKKGKSKQLTIVLPFDVWGKVQRYRRKVEKETGFAPTITSVIRLGLGRL